MTGFVVVGMSCSFDDDAKILCAGWARKQRACQRLSAHEYAGFSCGEASLPAPFRHTVTGWLSRRHPNLRRARQTRWKDRVNTRDYGASAPSTSSAFTAGSTSGQTCETLPSDPTRNVTRFDIPRIEGTPYARSTLPSSSATSGKGSEWWARNSLWLSFESCEIP